MNSSQTTRRRFICSLGALPLSFAGCQLTRPESFTLTLCGQALITHDLCQPPYPGLEAVIQELHRGDVSFTDLETAIQTPFSGPPTRDTQFLHIAQPDVLICLKQMGFDLLALSNNHAWDLGTPGITATRDVVVAGGFAATGSGDNAQQATSAAYAAANQVALVAMACGKIRDGAAATEHRPGVNEIRFSDSGEPDPTDVARISTALRTAAVNSPRVIAYLHNHLWGEDMATTKAWTRRFAHHCIDQGATIFCSHGAPLLHGIELYRGKPLFYGLGSLIFHSRTDLGHYPPEVWQSLIVHLHYKHSALRQIELVPVSLNEKGDNPADHLATRGRPRLATETASLAILERVQRLSAELGVNVQIHNNRGWINP